MFLRGPEFDLYYYCTLVSEVAYCAPTSLPYSSFYCRTIFLIFTIIGIVLRELPDLRFALDYCKETAPLFG